MSLSASNGYDHGTAGDSADTSEISREYLTIFVGPQMFGIPILQVQDVLGDVRITRVPLAQPEIAGSLNLRGRIVTAIDMRRRLGMEPSQNVKQMSVVVEHEAELYSLMFDKVGDVMNLSEQDFENNPATLDPAWSEISSGIFRLQKNLMVVLDIPRVLGQARGK